MPNKPELRRDFNRSNVRAGHEPWNSNPLNRIGLLMSETLDAILCLFLLGVLIAAALPISSYRTWHRSNEGASHPATFPNLPI